MRFARETRLSGRIMDRPAVTARGRASLSAGLVAALALVAGCDRVGNPLEVFGGGVPPPDEFQVIEYEPLVVPETYSLPEPTPGAPSPRAPNPQQEAVTALLGPGAARATAAGPSAGEQRLLASADAATASGDIRVQLEQDRQAQSEGPYEPPTLWELLGFGGDEDDIDETQVIDPDTEAERLQAQGIATPVDPDSAERAARLAAEEAEEALRPPPEPLDRRPNNRIGPAPQPAF